MLWEGDATAMTNEIPCGTSQYTILQQKFENEVTERHLMLTAWGFLYEKEFNTFGQISLSNTS